MKRSQTEPTTAKNLEKKFDRGEEVLDYFDERKARLINPRPASSGTKSKGAYAAKQDSNGRAVIREKLAAYRKNPRSKTKQAH